MPRALVATGMELEYDSFGDSAADMGHDLPEPLWPILVNAIVAHTSTVASVISAAVANR